MWNAGSLQNKLDDLLSLLEDEDLDVAAITETWFTTQNNNITAELGEKGFSIYHFNREIKKGGGVALIFRNNFKLINAKTFNFDTFECILVSIGSSSGRNLNFIVIYRYCEITPSLFLTEFYNFLENIFITCKNLIILGDFNLHVNDKFNPTIVKFHDILSSFNFTQLIDNATHKLGNTLDLVLCDTSDTKVKDVHIDFNNRSDHAYIFFKLDHTINPKPKKTVLVKNFSKIDIEHFKTDIMTNFENFSSDVDGNFLNSLCKFNDLCSMCIDNHVESKELTLDTNVVPKWIDCEFRSVRANRRKLYKRWKRTQTDTDRAEFENARRITHNLSIEKRSKYYTTCINKCNNCHKELFKICKNLLGKSNSSQLPSYTEPDSMARKFNDYFIGKIEKIRDLFPSKSSTVNGYGMDTYNGIIMSEFRPITQDEIKKLVLSKPMKTSPQDPIPAVLLKPCLNELLPALTVLVNLSLSTASMEGLKDTVVTPLLKKAGLDPEVLKNYRPVSNILYLSKLIERGVLEQFNDHMTLINGHTTNQSGYKPKHSCETLLIRVTNDIFISLDLSKCTIKILLDLSAAFDTVDHPVLLETLWYELGIRGKVYEWFASFLSNRKQAVVIDGHKSTFKENQYGVPQGSVLGPVLFNVYVRNLIGVLEREGYMVHGYADDHQSLFEFSIEFQVYAIKYAVPHCLDLISKWMTKHFLKLNPSKSQVIIFHPKSLSNQLVFERLTLSDGSYIPISQEVFNLGVILDSELTFSPQVSSIISQGYQLIRNIAPIRKFLSTEHVRTLVNSIVISKVDNGNSLLYGISSHNTERLQKFQNSCARLIFRKRKQDHVSHILRELHWLPAEARTYFKLLCYVYKCLHDLAPSYLSELVSIRRSHDLSLNVPGRFTTIGDRAFSSSGPRLWNALPVQLRLCNTLDNFKRQLKHYLFNSFQSYKLKINIYRS